MDLTYSAPTKIQCDANKDTAYERVAKCLHWVSDLLKKQTLVTWRISALRITICLTMHHSLIISSYEKHIKVFASKVELLVGEGSGTPLQYCCLENPMDGRAW